MSSAPTITTCIVNGLKVGVNVSGEGEPVVILHGWGTNLNSLWSVAVPLAQQGFQVHSLDLPGFGTSELPPEPWDVPRYGEFVLAYLNQAGLEQVRLIGHSFGGRLSIYLSAEHPARVKQVVLVDSAGVLPERTLNTRLYYFSRKVIFSLLSLPGLKVFQPRVREYMRQRFASEDYKNAGALAETFKLVVNQDLVPYARRIKAPTLLIWGDQDMDTPLRDAKLLEVAIPDAGLVVFEGAGHYSYLERTPEFLRIVTTFFRNG